MSFLGEGVTRAYRRLGQCGHVRVSSSPDRVCGPCLVHALTPMIHVAT